jgi:thiol-disulfide isomerase/thioredoxin
MILKTKKMKKIAALLTGLVLLSCSEKAPKDYVMLSGKVENAQSETLTIMGRNFRKDIALNEDGSFQDTLKVNDGFHGFNDGTLQSFVYLKNGYDLKLNFDVKDFPASVVFDGDGALTNNYLNEKLQFIKREQLDNYKAFFELEKEEFDARIEDVRVKMDKMLEEASGLEQDIVDLETKANSDLINFYVSNYPTEHYNFTVLQKGKPSPKFEYPDINGKQVSLDDLKGKYVYVDVWATWCGPCKKEIPYLKELDAEYKDKDLAIVSLSIDKLENKEKWRSMIKEQGLTGIQILADKDWRSEFVTAYNITGIPRFILIDPEGNIYDANAPRPSDPRLKELFNSLSL